MFDSISDKDFILLNTTAIDMEWKNKIAQYEFISIFYHVNYDGVSYNRCKNGSCDNYNKLLFNNQSNVNALPVVTIAFEYDIIKDLGEDNIRNTIKTEYQKYLYEGTRRNCCQIWSKQD